MLGFPHNQVGRFTLIHKIWNWMDTWWKRWKLLLQLMSDHWFFGKLYFINNFNYCKSSSYEILVHYGTVLSRVWMYRARLCPGVCPSLHWSIMVPAVTVQHCVHLYCTQLSRQTMCAPRLVTTIHGRYSGVHISACCHCLHIGAWWLNSGYHLRDFWILGFSLEYPEMLASSSSQRGTIWGLYWGWTIFKPVLISCKHAPCIQWSRWAGGAVCSLVSTSRGAHAWGDRVLGGN